DITVLLTGTGAPGAPGIIKCLKNNGERNIRIVGVDMNPSCGGKSLVDKFYQVPKAEDNDFIDKIKDICSNEKVDIIIPIVTRELSKFSTHKTDFLKLGIKISVMEEKKLLIANDKRNLFDSLNKSNILLPEYYAVKTLDEVIKAFKKLDYPNKPVCIKTTKGNGSRGIRIVNPQVSKYELFINSKPNSLYISYDELISTLQEKDKLDEMVVMEYLPGDEYSVDLLVDNGKTTHVVGRYNSLVSSSIPLGCTLEYREDAIKQAIEICEYLNLDGNIGIDFKYNYNNEPKLMEINPRLTATIVVSAVAGVNFPYLGIKKLLNEKYDNAIVQYGIRMIRRYEEVYDDGNGLEIKYLIK
ncbi:MAG: ATP-grasp domain-containing protein, partial [Candidatus Cloacimonetes bacterium]|nr:ATP-grasp domain-containing protein [Candidatus Cloacimonadota bacterium]